MSRDAPRSLLTRTMVWSGCRRRLPMAPPHTRANGAKVALLTFASTVMSAVQARSDRKRLER
jgi:hypothetical protein